MQEGKSLVLVNPKSAGGATGRRWPEIARSLEEAGVVFDHCFTTRAGEATDLTQANLSKSYTRIVAVGGDGTINEVVNGFFERSTGKPITTEVSLGYIPSGTGGDFRRSVGIPLELEKACAVLAHGVIRPVDVGLIQFHKGDKEELVWRAFINIADCGIGGEIVGRVNRSGKLFPGKLVYLYHSLVALLSYRARPVSLEVNEDVLERRVQNVVVANGRFFGGEMLVAPMAQVDDGWLDVIVIEEMPWWRSLWEMQYLLQGDHIGRSGIEVHRSRKVRVVPKGAEMLFDVDGEQIGAAPATITLLPAAIKLWCPHK